MNNQELKKKEEDGKKETILKAAREARLRHGGIARTAGMTLSLIQRMETLKIPDDAFDPP